MCRFIDISRRISSLSVSAGHFCMKYDEKDDADLAGILTRLVDKLTLDNKSHDKVKHIQIAGSRKYFGNDASSTVVISSSGK